MENNNVIRSDQPAPLPWELPNLTLNDESIWVPGNGAGGDSVSYPDAGNEHCFQIEDKSFWFQHRNQILIDQIRHYPPDGAILDVGGGNGYVTRGLSQAGFPSILLEPGYNGCLNARSRGIGSVICSTVEKAGFGEDAVSAFGLFDVLEHIDDDVGFLKYLETIAAPGSRLYLTVPALSCLWSEEDVIGGHFRRYSRASIRRVLERAGWNLDFSGYFFTYAVLPVLFNRVLQKRKHIESDVIESASQDHQAGMTGIMRNILKIANATDSAFLRNGGFLWGTSLAVVGCKANPSGGNRI